MRVDLFLIQFEIKTQKKVQIDENVEQLEDVVNRQLTVEMCSSSVHCSLIIFVMTVHCVKRKIASEES